MLSGDICLKERDIAVDTAVGGSETLCVLQVDQVCFKKTLSEKLFKHYRVHL